MQTILLLAGESQIASYFAEYYINNGDEVIGTKRSSRPELSPNLDLVAKNPRFSTRVVDLSDPYSIKKVIAGVKPDILINCASNSHVGSSWSNFYSHLESNSIGVYHVLEAIKEYCPGCKYLGFGSTEEFGSNDGTVNEETPLDPLNPYAVSKVCSRNIVKCFREGFGLYAVQHWISNTESPRRSEDFVTQKIVQGCKKIVATSGEYCITLGNVFSYKDFIHVGDVVRGCVNSLSLENPTEFCFGSGCSNSIYGFIERCFWALDFEFRRNFDSFYPEDLEDGQTLYFSSEGKEVIKYSNSFFRKFDFEYIVDYNLAYDKMEWMPEISFGGLIEDLLK